MGKKFVNLTKHNIVLLREDGTSITLPSTGTVARVNSESRVVRVVNKIPITVTVWGEIVGLPEPRADTIYVASTIVAMIVRRQDVVCPNTSPLSAIRGESGEIVGVRSLQSFYREKSGKV